MYTDHDHESEPSPESLHARVFRAHTTHLCRGENVVNDLGWHRSGLTGGGRGMVGWQPKVHHGALGIDVTADHEATGSALSALKTAAQAGVAQFAAAMSAEFGATFAAAVQPVMPVLRQDVLDLVP